MLRVLLVLFCIAAAPMATASNFFRRLMVRPAAAFSLATKKVTPTVARSVSSPALDPAATGKPVFNASVASYALLGAMAGGTVLAMSPVQADEVKKNESDKPKFFKPEHFVNACKACGMTITSSSIEDDSGNKFQFDPIRNHDGSITPRLYWVNHFDGSMTPRQALSFIKDLAYDAKKQAPLGSKEYAHDAVMSKASCLMQKLFPAPYYDISGLVENLELYKGYKRVDAFQFENVNSREELVTLCERMEMNERNAAIEGSEYSDLQIAFWTCMKQQAMHSKQDPYHGIREICGDKIGKKVGWGGRAGEFASRGFRRVLEAERNKQACK